jgi:hypothetical protein
MPTDQDLLNRFEKLAEDFKELYAAIEERWHPAPGSMLANGLFEAKQVGYAALDKIYYLLSPAREAIERENNPPV